MRRVGIYLGAIIALFGAANVWGGATFSKVKTVVAGEVITAADRNAEFDNVLDNLTPSGVDDDSASTTAMQTTVDPYPSGVASLPTSLQGELRRQRYQISQLSGRTYWYQDATNAFNYRRPQLIYINATTVDVSTNSGTDNTTTIIFPDGDKRSVTEDTNSTNVYRRFVITSTAQFTTGTEESGLYASAETANTWYEMYGVKSLISTTNFVVCGTTYAPTQENYSTLNTLFGTNGWVPLGLIRNGDNSGATMDILPFGQSGSFTQLNNTLASDRVGIELENEAVFESSISWTHAAGMGAEEVPGNIKVCEFNVGVPHGQSAGTGYLVAGSTSPKVGLGVQGDTFQSSIYVYGKTLTIWNAAGSGSAGYYCLNISGWRDESLESVNSPF